MPETEWVGQALICKAFMCKVLICQKICDSMLAALSATLACCSSCLLLTQAGDGSVFSISQSCLGQCDLLKSGCSKESFAVGKTCIAECDVQKRYIERAPGCHEPPPVPFQHRKGNRKTAPKPGTAEEARHQAQQAKALARVGPPLHSAASTSVLQLAREHNTSVCMGCNLSGLHLHFSLPRSQEASLVYDTKHFGMHIPSD